jgi:glycosyltransferase involved in cell wall biosynthesis
MRHSSNIIFISYDGLTEQLGQSQIVPYLVGIADRHLFRGRIIILSFDKPVYMSDQAEVSRISQILESAGIIWVSKRYHKKPAVLSTLIDVIAGITTTARLIRKYNINIIHARSYVPALIGLFFKKLLKMKFIFDMRGFWADERIEGGIWRKNLLYSIAKHFEKEFLLSADVIITLTESAKNEIASFSCLRGKLPKITIIPTAVDLGRFNFSGNTLDTILKEKFKDKLVFVYTGSLGTWYELDGLYKFFKEAKCLISNAHLLILTKQQELAKLKMQDNGLESGDVTILYADYANVPSYLNNTHVGLAFYKSGYSRKGCSPVKVGEYLACGLPVIITQGVGDTERIIVKENVGLIIRNFNEYEYRKVSGGLADLLRQQPDLGQRCRLVARKYFSLEDGIERYSHIYGELS